MRARFWHGFVACYLVAALGAGINAREVPATTRAGVVWAGALWPAVDFLPTEWTVALMPSWAFDFSKGSAQ